MERSRFKAEQIAMPRACGVSNAVRTCAGRWAIAKATSYVWKKEYGGTLADRVGLRTRERRSQDSRPRARIDHPGALRKILSDRGSGTCLVPIADRFSQLLQLQSALGCA